MRRLTRWKWAGYCTEIISTPLTDPFWLEGSWFWGNLKRCLCPVFLVSRWTFAQNRNLESFTFDQRRNIFIIWGKILYPIEHSSSKSCTSELCRASQAHAKRWNDALKQAWPLSQLRLWAVSVISDLESLTACSFYQVLVKKSKLSILTIGKLKFLSWLVIRNL